MPVRFLFAAVIFFPAAIIAQRLPEFLVEPGEILRTERLTAGTFARNPQDFIECRGRHFEGDPPPGISADFNGTQTGVAILNNQSVEEAVRAGSANQKALKSALARLEAVIRADPLFFPAIYNAGRILLLMNLPRRAVRYFDRARSVLPEFSGSYLNLGRAYARSGEDAAAVESFRQASRLNPSDALPLIALGDFYLERKSTQQARYYFERILALRPEYPDAKIGLARLYMEQGNIVRAQIILRSVPTDNQDGSERTDYNRALHYYLAVIASELRDYGDSVRQFDRLLKHPEDPFFLEFPIQEIRRRREIIFRLAKSEGTEINEDE